MDAARIVELAVGDYENERQKYRTIMYAAVLAYLAADASASDQKEKVKNAARAAFLYALLAGFGAGSDGKEPSADDQAWILIQIASEAANIDSLFDTLKTLRKDPDFTAQDAYDIANTRADGYAATLDGIYNISKVRGAGSLMLEFGGQDGHAPEFPCPECRKLRGQRHRASWWVSHGYIPTPGNTNFSCGCWQCKHFLFDDEGRVFTI